MLEKISAEDIDRVFLKCASTIRSQGAEIARLQAQVAGHERKARAEKIASTAVERGIMDPTQADEYAESLTTGDEDLDQVESFMNKASAVSGLPLGESLLKSASVVEDGVESAEERFETALLSSDD